MAAVINIIYVVVLLSLLICNADAIYAQNGLPEAGDLYPFLSQKGPVEVLPQSPALARDDKYLMMSFLDIVGFTKDSSKFVKCFTGDTDFMSCDIIDINTRKIEKISASKDGIDWNREANNRLQQRLKNLGIRNRKTGQWAFHREIHIIWEQKGNSKIQPASLQIWLEHRDTGIRTQLAKRSTGNPWATIFVEDISLSPNGLVLTLTDHTFSGEFTDSFTTEFIEIKPKVAQLYNLAGKHFCKKGKLENGLSAFRKAAAVFPEHPVAAYNSASTAALLGNETFGHYYLKKDIAIHGDATRKKARNDRNFSNFQDKGWFIELVKPKRES